MKEKLMVSGRFIEGLYPHVNVWGFGIPLYLFIGGLAAGMLIFASLFYILGKEKEMPVTIKIGTTIPFFIIVIGLLFLIGDLKHKLYFWQLMLHFRLQSPMSWGSWVLVLTTILSLLWPLSFITDIKNYFTENNKKTFAKWATWIEKMLNKWKLVVKIMDWFTKYRKNFAYAILFLSIVLGIYTGILLSSFNARPLWNTSILALIFLVSGISTGAAALMWISRDHKEKTLYSKLDLGLIATELVLIGLMLLGMVWGTDIQHKAVELFLGGEFTAVFWGLFVMLGLILPFTLEVMELKGKRHIPIAVPAFLVLLGGLIFRIIMVAAGQFSTFTF